MDERAGQIEKLNRLERRDWQLWGIAILVILSLTATIIGLQAPDLVGTSKQVSSQVKLYISALSILVFLFCIYVIQSVHSLRKVKTQLSHTEFEKNQIQELLTQVAEQADKLKVSETNYRALLESNADALIVIDREKNVCFLNHSAKVMCGHAGDEMIGRPFPYPIDQHQRSEIEIASSGGAALTAELRIFETAWEGKKAFLASLHDITVRKQAEDTLRKANEELKKLDRMKSDFISVVSHELRTPLSTIKNAAGLLASGKTGEVSPDQERFLSMMVRNIDRLGGIINDLLDLSKIESGKMPFRFSELNPHPLFQHIIETFQPQAKANSLVLELDCPESLPTVYADGTRIEQVFCNLLSNAMKFTGAGGRVTLAARPVGDRVELSVSDTGVGLSEEDQKRVFEKFYQAEDPLTRSTKGTGLGLAITREIVQAHGGKIGLESVRGKGSRFFFSLPIFSRKAIEMAEFEAELNRYRDHPCLSLILLHLGLEDQSRSESALERLSRQLRTILPRSSDQMIGQPHFSRLLILLAGTPKWGAVVVRQKLEKVLLGDSNFWKEIPGARPVLFGPASYPEDGHTAADLVSAAERTA